MLKRIALIAVAGGLALGGCLGPRTISGTPRFTVQPALQVTAVAQAPYTLAVRPLMVASPYNIQMAYLGADQRFGYRGEEWAEAPGALVTRALRDAVDATKRFKDSGSAGDLARPDFMLSGELRKFHEDRTQMPYAAVCELRLEMRPALKKGVVWAKTLTAAVPLESPGEQGSEPAALAKAMSAAVGQIVNEAAKTIAEAQLPAPADEH